MIAGDKPVAGLRMRLDIEVSRGAAKIIANCRARSAKCLIAEQFTQEIKDPRLSSGLSSKLSASKSIRYSGLSSGLLDRPVGVARQTGIHLTELRYLGDMGFINHPGVLRLDLDYVPE